MAAIESNEWCLISYKRDDIETTILCYPLELRISSINGREYLMYYEPFKRSCAPLRLEFIESIQYYHDHDVKKCMSTYFTDEEINVDIDRSINKAKLLMEYTWGVSSGSVQERNIDRLNSIFRELHVRINYNKDTDYYILNRIYRESRNGTIVVNEEDGYIDFGVVVADIKEVIPFVRSFYSRVISCTGYDDEGFSVEMDIKQIVGRVINKEFEDETETSKVEREIWRTDEKFLSLLGDGIKATDTVDQRRTHHTTDSFQPLLGLHIPPNARGRRSLMMNTIRYSWSTFRKSSTVFFLAPHIRRTLFQHWKLWSHCTDGTLC